ncbi:hypothetical protein [Pseudomonas aeruginosa]|uniref:hypothetical protein n=1 Tax=Pseudomonas aeruginosa TaxID=287 RepID=UPI002F3F1ACD
MRKPTYTLSSEGATRLIYRNGSFMTTQQTVDELNKLDRLLQVFVPPVALRDATAAYLKHIEAEDINQRNDDEHRRGELVKAAISYAVGATHLENVGGHRINIWPWFADQFHPTDRRGNLLQAIALLLREIDRVDRECKEPAA